MFANIFPLDTVHLLSRPNDERHTVTGAATTTDGDPACLVVAADSIILTVIYFRGFKCMMMVPFTL